MTLSPTRQPLAAGSAILRKEPLSRLICQDSTRFWEQRDVSPMDPFVQAIFALVAWIATQTVEQPATWETLRRATLSPRFRLFELACWSRALRLLIFYCVVLVYAPSRRLLLHMFADLMLQVCTINRQKNSYKENRRFPLNPSVLLVFIFFKHFKPFNCQFI